MDEFMKLVAEGIKLSAMYKKKNDIINKLYKKHNGLFKGKIKKGEYFGISPTGYGIRMTYHNNVGDISVDVEIKVDAQWGK